jgi:cytochrome c oxidase subunit 2
MSVTPLHERFCGGKMKTLKTIVIALALAAMPAFAQDAAPSGPAPAATPAAAAPVPAFQYAAPTPGIGVPVAGKIGLQPQVTEIGQEAAWMHNVILVPLITVISLFVLGLLFWVVARYRVAANPVASKTSHNTVIEIIWTLVPVLILVAIAVPSIRLLAHQFSPPKADLTVKVIGNQWYWTYQYPDNGDFEVVSNMLKEKDQVPAGQRFRTDADGPRLLAADERMVVPAGATVKIITTAADVIHSFAVPAFWIKMDAVPGRLNETWFKVPADKTGVYFGQCSELCGARHAFMPIAIEVVTPARFAEWVKTKGGTMPGAKTSAAETLPAVTPSPAPPVTPGAGPLPTPGTATPAVTAQAATAQN